MINISNLWDPKLKINKSSFLGVGQRLTVQTQIRRNRTLRLVQALIFSDERERGYIEPPGGIIELLGLDKASV